MVEDGIGVGAIVQDAEDRYGEVVEVLGSTYVMVLFDDDDWPVKHYRDELSVIEDAPEEDPYEDYHSFAYKRDIEIYNGEWEPIAWEVNDGYGEI